MRADNDWAASVIGIESLQTERDWSRELLLTALKLQNIIQNAWLDFTDSTKAGATYERSANKAKY